jgi:hypothetical protein
MKIAVSLYFWGEGLIPAKISNVLGVSPTQSQAKGEVKTTSTGKKVTAKGGMWGFSSDYEVVGQYLSEHISFLRSKLGQRASQIPSLEGVQDSCVDVFIAAETGAEGATCEFELTTANVAALMELGLPVRFTVAQVKE